MSREKLLAYSLGRTLDYRDMPAVRAIVRQAQRRNYSLAALIQAWCRATLSCSVAQPLHRRAPGRAGVEHMAVFITRKALSRRTLLRGAGAAIALPLLESMLPAMAATPAPKPRFGAIYFPHGATLSRWTPQEEGANFTFSEILQPLAPFRAHINVVSNLGHPLAYGPGGATGNHNRSSASFLSGAKAASGAQPRLGITVDQVAVKTLGQDTPLPSLELMIEDSSLVLRRRAFLRLSQHARHGRASFRRCPCRTIRRSYSNSCLVMARMMRSAPRGARRR